MVNLFVLAAMAAAQTGPATAPYTATISSLGDVVLTDGSNPVATLGFGAASEGWAWVGRVPDPDAAEPIESGFTWPGGRGVVLTRVQARDGGVEVELQATPQAAGRFESVHFNLQSSVADWVGGQVSLDGGAPTAIPPALGATHLLTADARSVRLAKGARRIDLELAAAAPVLVQDGRQWGDSLDVRMGIRTGEWAAGEARTWRVMVRADRPIRVGASGPTTIQAGDGWVPYEAKLDIEPGSALDWAPKTVRVPGSRGWLIVRNGRFVEERAPNEPLRFYGANLCFGAAVPDRETADRLAERLMRLGYNTVRFHHYDVELTGGFVSDQPGDSTALVADAMDRFDYLFAALKRRGIWSKIDLFTIRQIRRDEVLPGVTGMDEYKALLLVDEGARQNWLRFARNLMNHVNPHTGLAYKDDPALAWICVVNENNAGSAARNLSPAGRAKFDAAWQRDGGEGPWRWDTDEGARWAADRHAETYRWMRDRLQAMGVRALLTDNNGWHEQTALIRNRVQLDFVDNHNYWDHPNFLQGGWAPPSRGAQGGSAVPSLAGGLRNMALTRVKGLPFTVSEMNFCAPNPFRAEGGLLLGAFAARQDWDAVWRFAFSHSLAGVREPVALDYFNVQSDPMGIASERAAIALFLRRDLAPARAEAVVRVDPATAGAAPYRADVAARPLDVRLFSAPDQGQPNPNPPTDRSLPPARVEDGALIVAAPRTAGVVGPVGRRLAAGPLTVTLAGSGGALWANALDGRPVGESRRLLVVHLTDAQNTEAKFDGPDLRTLLAWGRLPHLIRDGSAEVRLRTSVAGLRAWRLDASGRRIAVAELRREGDEVVLDAAVRGPAGATLYYEIAER